MSAAATLIYWGIVARGTPAYLVAALGGETLNWDTETANAWPAAKSEAPFGQLPFVRDGDVKIAQSMALVRYFARKHNLQGDSLAAYGSTEQITEEASSLFEGLAKCKYGADPLADYNKYFDTYLPAQLAYLENLLTHSFFSGEKPLQGDAALYSAIYIIGRCNADKLNAALAHAPKVAAWKAAFEAIPSIAAAKAHLDTLGAYFTWPQ